MITGDYVISSDRNDSQHYAVQPDSNARAARGDGGGTRQVPRLLLPIKPELGGALKRKACCLLGRASRRQHTHTNTHRTEQVNIDRLSTALLLLRTPTKLLRQILRGMIQPHITIFYIVYFKLLWCLWHSWCLFSFWCVGSHG